MKTIEQVTTGTKSTYLRTRKITTYVFMLSTEEYYYKDFDANVMFVFANNKIKIGSADTRDQFIKEVLNHINKVN